MWAWIQWGYENWMWLAVAALLLVTFQFWFKPLVQFVTETKVGGALAAAAIAYFAGRAWLAKDRSEHIAIGRAQAEREARLKISPKAAPQKHQKEWWLGKK